MGKTVPPIPPALCVDCGGVPHWRYRDRMRWHCVACCPCPDPDDATFTWDPAPDALGSSQGDVRALVWVSGSGTAGLAPAGSQGPS